MLSEIVPKENILMKLSRMVCYPFCTARCYKVKEVKSNFIRAIHPESLMDKRFTEKVNKVNPYKPIYCGTSR